MHKTLSSMKSTRQGFTLMEVLVSSALTVVILTMLFTVLIGAMNAWQTGTNRLQGNADARMALDSIAQDLQSMVVRQTTLGARGQEWLYSELRPVYGLSDVPNKNSMQLYFFAPSLDRQPGQQGDIVAIQYQVAFADPLRGDPDGNVTSTDYNIFGLYKRMESTLDTFQFVLGQEDIWVSYWQGRNVPRPRDLMIPNVVDFSIKWNVNGNGDTGPADVILPGGVNFEVNALRLNNALRAGPSMSDSDLEDFPSYKLESADISLTILTDEGMRMVQTFTRGPGLNTDNLNRVIREHGRVYTKRVKIEY